MEVQGADLRALGYCVTFTIINYTLSPIFIVTPKSSLGARLAIVILAFAAMYMVARIFYGNPFKNKYQSPYFDSFIHVLALIGIISIFSLPLIILFEGVNVDINEIYVKAKPAFVDSWGMPRSRMLRPSTIG